MLTFIINFLFSIIYTIGWCNLHLEFIHFFKPLPALLLGWMVGREGGGSFYVWAGIGDMFMNYRGIHMIGLGLMSFAIAHMILMMNNWLTPRLLYPFLILTGIVEAIVITIGLKINLNPMLLRGIMIYVVLLLYNWMSSFNKSWIVTFSMTNLIISDAILAYDLFIEKLNFGCCPIIITYWLGINGLAWYTLYHKKLRKLKI